jgi:MoaA/NifB/PqqE/SkfB family radical SAM enzyme
MRKILNGFPPMLELEGKLHLGNQSFIGIHMGPVCNFRCKKCFIGRMEGLKDSKKPLSLVEIKTILLNARKNGVEVLGITGLGEPLFDKNLFDVIDIASNLGFITHLVTNASMLSEEKLIFLKERNVTLVMSLDAVDSKAFAELTGTNEAMFFKVRDNIMLAQKVFQGTRNVKRLGGETVEIFRLAMHVTVSDENIGQIQELKNILDPAITLFSVSPVAKIKSAESNNFSLEDELAAELQEKHIVVVKNPVTKENMCGFFLFGLDINFDGEILLDAHIIESRNLLSNIRDFNLDPKKAFEATIPEKERFIKESIEGFCPARSPKLKDFLEQKKTRNNQGRI